MLIRPAAFFCSLFIFFAQFVPLHARPAPAETRTTVPLTFWKFNVRPPAGAEPEQKSFGDGDWQAVSVPHTWNSKTQAQTHRAAWYRTHFTLLPMETKREIFACFDGAGTIADVYLNGVLLGSHRGAYTRFVFDGTQAAQVGDNVLAVRCDTDPADTSDCLPAGNGYQLYHVPGGWYRPVHLLETSAVHVDPADNAASGVFITPSAVSRDGADLAIKTLVRNDGSSPAAVTVTTRITGGAEPVAAMSGQITLAAHSGGSVTLHTHIPHPHLWSTTDPYLYQAVSETTVGGVVTDAVTEKAGLRWFQMTAAGFFLNGISTPLRGVAKHQETEQGSAVSEADLRRDWADLADLGVNYVRLAHYPHAKLEYDLADALGIVVWAENGHSNPAPPTETGRQITREMILQNYNHPSICFWSIGNEAIRALPDIATL